MWPIKYAQALPSTGLNTTLLLECNVIPHQKLGSRLLNVSQRPVEPQNIHRDWDSAMMSNITCLGGGTGGTRPSLETQCMNVPKLSCTVIWSTCLFRRFCLWDMSGSFSWPMLVKGTQNVSQPLQPQNIKDTGRQSQDTRKEKWPPPPPQAKTRPPWHLRALWPTPPRPTG